MQAITRKPARAGVLQSRVMPHTTSVVLFEDVYRREYPGLYSVASALTGDREGAHDLVHDAMVKAFMRWEQVSQLDRPGAWCHRVLVNACRSRWRRLRVERRYLARLSREEPVSPPPSTDAIAFWSAARTLPDRPRTVVALYFGGELTSVQIAQLLGIPEGTVRSDLSTARRVILTALREDQP